MKDFMQRFTFLRDEEGGNEGAAGGGGATGLVDIPASNGDEGGAPKQEQSAPRSFTIYRDGDLDPEFAKNLDPEKHKGFMGLAKKYATAEDPMKELINGVQNLQFLARSKLKDTDPLPDDAPEELRKERAETIRKINGAPKDPEGYGLAKPEDLPENVVWPEGVESKYAEVLHRHGASPALAKELMDMHTGILAEEARQFEAEQQQHIETENQALAQKFGDKVQRVKEDAIRGGRTLGLDDETIAAALNSAKMVEAFSKIRNLVSEDTWVNQGGRGTNGRNPGEEADDIMNNKANPDYEAYWNRSHPRSAQVRQKVLDLRERDVATRRR